MNVPKITAESLKQTLHSQVDQLAEQMAQSVNDAPEGALIDGSEEAAREAIHKFGLAAYQAALQKRLDAAEAAFPPSAEPHEREAPAE